MWKAIRLHPWRLEIVPAAAFGFAVWQLHVYRTQAAPFLATIRGLHGSDPFGTDVAWTVCMVLFLWIISMGVNQRWVESERRKRFSWLPHLFSLVIIMRAWVSFVFTRTVLDLKHPVRGNDAADFPLFGAMLLTGFGLSLVLELTRRYVPREDTPEPPLPAGEVTQVYRETQIDWWLLPTAPFMLAMVAIPCTQNVLPKGAIVPLLAIGLAAVALLLSLTIKTLSVTPETVTYRLGPIPGRYRVSDIVSCAPAHQETWTKQSGRKIRMLGITDGRCVEITMTNGRVYRLGALRPTHICQLIGKTPADVSEADG